MLTKLRMRNFRRLDDVEIELGSVVVFIGPNNSGKTAALQALALWEAGLRRWRERRSGRQAPKKRAGVTVNRLDLIALPVPEARLLWRNLHVRNVRREGGAQKTDNVCIEVIVEGVTGGAAWECGLEFYYANPESFYCRPLRTARRNGVHAISVPEEALGTRIAFLPPMSGLAAVETRLETGRINVLLGEGQTAQVLRNLCYRVYSEDGGAGRWEALCDHIRSMFGVELQPPDYIPERGEITMTYREGRVELDLSCAGRGLQQVLLLLAHLYLNPHSTLLLDEPDAHLEIIRQRQIYQVLTDVARQQDAQIIAASHSEVVLNEAADRDVVVAFVGKPHRIDDRGSQALKALRDIGFEDYLQAEQVGWVLYLEGSTDLAILRAFAETLEHAAAEYLERPFVKYFGNQPQRVRDHFHGLRDAKPDLVGIAIFDRLERLQQEEHPALRMLQWRKREIENYLCQEEALLAYARGDEAEDLFSAAERDRRVEAMPAAIHEIAVALETLGEPSPWSDDIKATDQFLDRVFRRYYEAFGQGQLGGKSDYQRLCRFIPADKIDPEVVEKLDAIVQAANAASPRTD